MNLKTQLTENYKKEIEVLKGIFGESIEKAGGKGQQEGLLHIFATSSML